MLPATSTDVLCNFPSKPLIAVFVNVIKCGPVMQNILRFIVTWDGKLINPYTCRSLASDKITANHTTKLE